MVKGITFAPALREKPGSLFGVYFRRISVLKLKEWC